ncbi:MAG: F0F1 ATP synthase subunit A [Thermoanaerobaculia bacterium]|nr:F0F1 ATP synthase subunit A [Thermoanaerobaculia bacterium]
MEHHHSIMYGPVNAVWEWLLSITGLASTTLPPWAKSFVGQDVARLGEVQIPDYVAMSIFVFLVLVAIFLPLKGMLREENPGKFQIFLEQLVHGLKNLIDDQIGHGASERYLPLMGAMTLFIFFCNICGLFFFLTPPSQSVNMTFGLAFFSFFLYNWIGIKTHGWGYVKHFLGPIPLLAPLFIIVELVSHNARWLSLGLRLFGNITGEHTGSGVFNDLIPLLVPLPLMALGRFAAVIQTFIFVMLTVVYIAGAEAEEH